MKPWHSLSLSAEILDASWVLHSSVCLATWSKVLLIALTLAWSKSFSAFLMICLALEVLILLGLSYVIQKDLLWSKAWNGKCAHIFRWSVQNKMYLPHKTVSDRRWSLCWSMSSMRAHSKQMAELGQVFWWSAQLGQLVRWSTQISCQIYPQYKMMCTDGRIRSSFQMKCSTRSTCQMKCSDIPPKNKMTCTDGGIRSSFRWSVQTRSTCQMKVLRYTPYK